jgi:hypothetical protein
MLSFLTRERIRSNRALLCEASRSLVKTDRDPRGSTASDERDAYFEALNVLQEAVLPPARSSRPEIRLHGGDDHAVSLLSVLGLSKNWADQALATDVNEVTKHMEAALTQLEQVGSSAQGFFGAIADLVSVVVFAGDFFGGGMSEGHNLGLVCIGMGERREPEVVHFAETLIHETTHQALFLEDMLHRVFTDDARVGVSANPLQAYSTTRSTARPYDVAFHAACVTATLEMYRSVAGRADSLVQSDSVATELERSIHDLDELRGGALTPVGSSILDELIQLI